MGSVAKRPLAESIAEQLRAALAGKSAVRLPNLRDLAARYHVSRPTMLAAVRLLVNEGLLEAAPGRGIWTRDNQCPCEPLPRRQAAWRQVYDELHRAIVDGDLRMADPLPKVSYVCARMHKTQRIVQKAYAELLRTGVIRREGKRFLVGPPTQIDHSAASRRPAIHIICPRSPTWLGLCRARRTEQFAFSFEQQADRTGTAIHQIMIEPDAKVDTVDSARADMLWRVIRQFPGTRGLLIVGQNHEHDDFDALLKTVGSLDHKVVWFDRNGDGFPKDGVHPRRIVRCYYDETESVRTALEFLSERGHRSLLYPYSPESEWQVRRWQVVRELCAARFQSIRPTSCAYCIDAHAVERLVAINLPFMRGMIDTVIANRREIEEYCAGVPASSIEPYRSHRFYPLLQIQNYTVHHGLPSMDSILKPVRVMLGGLRVLPFLEDRSVSAILAPNLSLARMHRVWLSEVGIDVPQCVSLLGFDDIFPASHLHMSTVNHGFSTLGYHAFHALLGGIPLPRDRDGGIRAIPFVVDRGSVAQLRNSP